MVAQQSRIHSPFEQLCFRIQAILSQDGQHQQLIQTRRKVSSFADLHVMLGARPRDRQHIDSGTARKLRQLREIAEIRETKLGLALRLSEEAICAYGEFAFAQTAIQCQVTPKDKIHLIGFLAPNTCKALHLGHLRNIVVGNAFASVFRAAGRVVEAYSLVGDIGRSVCEAMAGFSELRQADPRRSPLVKGDHLVGLAYRRYLAANDRAEPEVRDPCSREYAPKPDHAEQLLMRWSNRDPEVRELWQAVCLLVDRGHRETLDQLGIRIDRHERESAHIVHAHELMRRGLEAGILSLAADGSVVFETGRQEFDRLVLRRPDGFPTEHGRVLATFSSLFNELFPGCTHIDWSGMEWSASQIVMQDLMERMNLVPEQTRHVPRFHGMVTFLGEEMSSSKDNPILIDDLLDRLRKSSDVAQFQVRTNANATATDIADIVLKAYFLCFPVTKTIEYSWPRLLDPKINKGWKIAEAWCRATSRAERSGPALSGVDAGYRLAVMQCVGLQDVLEEGVANLDYSGVVDELLNFSSQMLVGLGSAQSYFAAQEVLRQLLRSLGFSRALNSDIRAEKSIPF